MKFLVVGSGSIGQRHLSNLRVLRPDSEIILLQRANSSTRVDQLAVQPTHVVHSLNDALKFQPQAAVIASPATKHLDTAIPLAKKGIHLLVEKPLAATSERIDELCSACEANSCTLMVAYNLRFHPALVQVKELLAQNKIGKVLSVRAEVGQYLPDWRPDTDYRTGCSARSELGGGVLLELSHELDYVQWLLGPASHVSAIVDRVSNLEIDVEDLAEINLRFESGAVGNIHLDFLQRAPYRQCRIIGELGTITWDAIAGEVRIYTLESPEWTRIPAESATGRNQMYLDELEHFLECTEKRTQPIVSGSDGARALRLALAARKSSYTGETVAL